MGWNNEPAQYYSAPMDNAADALNRSPNSRSVSMQAFLDSYQKLEQSGGLQNPEVQNVVSGLSAKIAYLSETIESNVSDRYWGNTTTPLQDYIVSNTSYWDSSQICSTGNGNTIGVHCQ